MAFMLQFLVAVFSLYLETGKTVVQKLSNGARHIIDFSQEGVNFVFGPLANEWSFAINALPVIVFSVFTDSGPLSLKDYADYRAFDRWCFK